MPTWPRAQRPRERLRALGPGALSDAELLAILLRTGSRGRSALGLARAVLALADARGGLAALQDADLRAFPGIGAAKAASVLAALEWGRRCGLPKPEEAALRGPRAAYEALLPLFVNSGREQVVVLALDSRRRVRASEVVSQGTLTQSLAHPREVFRTAVKLGAAALVVGHNHPSGDPSPSQDDHAMTRRMREAAEVLGIPLVDHVIVGDGRFHSYADTGWVY
ncbi:MAG: RadC family protein [bacterium]